MRGAPLRRPAYRIPRTPWPFAAASLGSLERAPNSWCSRPAAAAAAAAAHGQRNGGGIACSGEAGRADRGNRKPKVETGARGCALGHRTAALSYSSIFSRAIARLLKKIARAAATVEASLPQSETSMASEYCTAHAAQRGRLSAGAHDGIGLPWPAAHCQGDHTRSQAQAHLPALNCSLPFSFAIVASFRIAFKSGWEREPGEGMDINP